MVAFELRHNDFPVGVIRDGAVEVSDACNDEAFAWAGLRALGRHRSAAVIHVHLVRAKPPGWQPQA